MIIDIEAFKARKPWLDVTFYAAIFATLAMLIPLVADAWGSAKFPTGEQLGAATLPLTAYLIMHGLIRKESVKAYGRAVQSEVSATTHADALVSRARIEATAAATLVGDPSPDSDAEVPEDQQVEVLRLRDILPLTPEDREAIEAHDARRENV